jgi:glycosyltransferase involved in cell wall biosynthesis
VFSQTIGPVGGLGLFISRCLRKKTVAYIHSIEWDLFVKATTNKKIKKYGPYFTKKLVRFLYNSCKELLLPSQRIEELITWQGVKTPKTIIHLGVDTKRFKKKDASALRTRLGIKKDDVVIGYHGRIAKEKDISTLLRGFVKLRNVHPNLKLLIVGNGVESIIKKAKKQPDVIYIPAQDCVEDYLNAMDIYCLPSLTETTSLSTLEAMSCELPVVTTPVGFVRDYVKDGINGYFFKEGDSYDLNKKIEDLLQHKKTWKELGKNGRKLVEKNFDWDVTAEQLITFFAANM